MDNKQSFEANTGNCVSVQQSSDPVTVSINSQGNSAEIKSPIKAHMTATVDDHSTAESNSKSKSSSLVPHEASFRDLSDREAMFFDSQTWLESDCEDFLSIDGDYAPSCGSSPTFHQVSFVKVPEPEVSFYVSSAAKATAEPSPKQLIDLFGESFANYMDATDSNRNQRDRKGACKPIAFYLPTKWTSRKRRETTEATTPARCFNTRKEQSGHSVKCCFPGLVQSFSFCERKKKQSPAHDDGP